MSNHDPAAELTAKLIALLHGEDSLTNPPDGGKVRQPDSQTKPWKALGISRATWYRQRKPGCRSMLSSADYWRQKNRAKNENYSIRSVQRFYFASRYGISEVENIARHFALPAAILEEVAKWEHEDQRRFIALLISELPLLETDDPIKDFRGVVIRIQIRNPVALKRAGKRAFDRTLAEMISREAAP